MNSKVVTGPEDILKYVLPNKRYNNARILRPASKLKRDFENYSKFLLLSFFWITGSSVSQYARVQHFPLSQRVHLNPPSFIL
jgi:hypothetical protein